MTDVYQLPEGFKLISGGQAGADTAALDWAISNSVGHDGWCPKGRKSETGRIDQRYLLTETPSAGYLQRTEWNVRDSDATLIFTMDERLGGGSGRTAAFSERHGKPWFHFRPGVHAKFVARFLAVRQVRILNVAGRRASAAPGIEALVMETLDAALRSRGELTKNAGSNDTP